MSDQQRVKLKALFRQCDTNGDGTLSREEIWTLFSSEKMAQDDFDNLWSMADANNDGSVN